MREGYQPTVSGVLRAILDYEGIDGEQLAERMGKSGPGVRKWLRGDAVPQRDNLVALADALDAPGELFVRPPATRDEVFAAMLAWRGVRDGSRRAFEEHGA